MNLTEPQAQATYHGLVSRRENSVRLHSNPGLLSLHYAKRGIRDEENLAGPVARKIYRFFNINIL